MNELTSQVRSVRRRAQRLVLLYGLGWFLAVVLVVAFAVGLADYLIRFQDTGVRIICSLAVVAAMLGGFLRFVLPALARRASDVQIAQRIEQRFPELDDRLSSAIAFLHTVDADRTAGSADLRRAVVAETSDLVKRLDLFDCLDARLPRRMAAAVLLLLVVTGGVCLWDMPSSALAARRLVMPWGGDPWPRRHQLAFLQPPRQLAAGDHFEVVLTDRGGRLPRLVTVETWYAGDDKPQPRELTPDGGAVTVRLENVTRSFRYRARGGDDETMPWHRLNVVQPPRVSDVRITLTPPAYTGRGPHESDRQIRALEGTRIELAARASKPLESVTLEADFPLAQHARLSADGTSFVVPGAADEPWLVQRSGRFWFALKDRQGTSAGTRAFFEIQAVVDEPPTVSLETPRADEFFTADAVVPVKAIVKDDLAVRSIVLLYQQQRIVLLDAAQARTDTADPAAAGGDMRVVEHAWDLSELGLRPGDSVEFHVEAADFKPQPGQRATRRLTIVSTDELEDHIDQAQSRIHRRIEEALRVQRTSRSQTKSVEIQLEETPALGAEDVDYLQSAELNQRQVQQLISGAEGAAAMTAELLASLASNRVNQPEVTRRIETLLAQLRGLERDQLPDIQHHLNQALKSARTVTPQRARRAPPRSLVEPLQEAGGGQEKVIAALEGMLRQLSGWSSIHRFSREAGQILRRQDDVMAATNRLQTVAKAPAELTPAEQAALRRLAQQQLEVGQEIERLLAGMEQARQRLAPSDPTLAANLARAGEAAQDQAISAAAREASRDLEQNRVGRAATLQRELRAGLRDLLDALANRGRQRAAQLQQEVAALAARQQVILDDTRKADEQLAARGGAASEPWRQATTGLAAAQRELADATTVAAERTAAQPVLGFALERAGRQMLLAADLLQRMQTTAETQQLQADAHARLRSLLAALEPEAESRPAAEPPAPPAPPSPDGGPQISLAELKLLRLLQLEIHRRTVQLNDDRPAAPGSALTEAQQRQLDRLADEQQALFQMLEGLVSRPAPGEPAAPRSPDLERLDEALEKANLPGSSEE